MNVKLSRVVLLCLLLSFPLYAEKNHGGHNMNISNLSKVEQLCYAQAMIGFDSVVNARQTPPVQPEHALEIVKGHEIFPKDHPMDWTTLLTVIYGAYLTKSTAHGYAVNTFSICLQKSYVNKLED